MLVSKNAVAGTLQSNDCLITIEPADILHIELESPVETEFGDQILSVVNRTLSDHGINLGNIRVQDQGALDCTIEARLITAIRRSR